MQGPRDDFPAEGGGGPQPADGPPDSLNGVEIAQTGPPKTPDRQKPQDQGKSQRERLKYRIEDQFEGRLPGVEQNERLERLTMAIHIVTYALEELRKDPAIQAKLAEHGITLKGTAYYLPIIIKESALKPDMVSASNAKGYFQILVNKKTGESQTLTEVEKYFGRKFSPTEISYSGKEITKQYEAAKKNAMAGILYWHICRDVYWKKKDLPISERDRDRVAATCYNLGPTAFLDLWDTLKPQDFTQFARLIGKKLAREFPENIAIPEERRPDAYHDDTYNIGYWVHAYETGILSDSQEIKIEKYTYKAKKLLTVLRYAELIDAMMGNAPAATKKLPEPAVAPTTTPSPTATPTPTPEIPGAVERRIYKKITLKKGESLWSYSEDLRKQAKNVWKIDAFEATEDPEDHPGRQMEREMLIQITVDFNNEYNTTKIDDVTAIPANREIWLPNKAYIEYWIQQREEETSVSEEVGVKIEGVKTRTGARPETIILPPPPEVRGLTRRAYVDASLEAAGIQIPKNPEGFSLAVKKPERKLKTKVVYENPHGLKDGGDRSQTTNIILHSTNASNGSGADRGLNGVLRNNRAHYVISREGIIYQVRDPNDKMDHAGRITNRRASKAMWDGDGYINDKSIGIEVATYDGEEYNKKQYEAVRYLVHALGAKYKIPANHVLAHSQVTCGRTGRGLYRFTKSDPLNLKWSKLDLPNNYQLIDYDVLNGNMQANWRDIPRMDGNNVDKDLMFSGVKKSEELAKNPEFKEQVEVLRRQAVAQWKEEIRQKSEIKVYTVVRGDSLYELAKIYGTTVAVIMTYNDLKSSRLRVGQRLEIPKTQ